MRRQKDRIGSTISVTNTLWPQFAALSVCHFSASTPAVIDPPETLEVRVSRGR